MATIGTRSRFPRMDHGTKTPPDDALHAALARNIDALEHRRHRRRAHTSRQTRLAEAITEFAGSMRFVALHLVVYGAWIVLNLGIVPGVHRFDPSFGTLSMVASVEAIFLSTFVLITQNRMAELSDQRADLDLHIGLLTEHELTRLTGLVASIGNHLGVAHADAQDIEDIQRDVAPEAVLDALEARQQQVPR